VVRDLAAGPGALVPNTIELSHSWSTAGMTWVGGDDSDMETVSGTYGSITRVAVTVEDLAVSGDGRSVTARVRYVLSEERPEDAERPTRLEFDGAVAIPVPDGWIAKRVQSTPWSYYTFFEGRNHHWNALPIKDRTACVRRAEARIDGHGSDEHNACLKLEFCVRVEADQDLGSAPTKPAHRG
jgi:hypothetical protein